MLGVSSTTSFFSSHHKNRPAIWPALICGRLSEREGANCPSTAQNFRQNKKKRATTTAHAAVFPRGRKCTRRGAATRPRQGRQAHSHTLRCRSIDERDGSAMLTRTAIQIAQGHLQQPHHADIALFQRPTELTGHLPW